MYQAMFQILFAYMGGFSSSKQLYKGRNHYYVFFADEKTEAQKDQ